MEKYNIGEVWWVHFPYEEKNIEKRRPAIVIDNETIAILAMYVTSQNKDNPYSIKIDDWEEAGLSVPSWTRIDKIVRLSEWNMDKKIGRLSEKDLIKIMQLVAEITVGTCHEFSLIAIENKAGKYLQKYDDRWKCWLFPYVRSSDQNKENVTRYVNELLAKDTKIDYITHAKHCKYSVSDEVYKIYHHKLYRALVDDDSLGDKKDVFLINGVKFKWMSFEEMEKDANVMKKNEEIVAFVKKAC